MAGIEGRTLDRYKLKQQVGRGGMADVYLADDTQFTRRVAVKVFQRENEDLLRRFIREAQMMASLRHPHLIPVYDSGTCQLDGANFYYIVMPMMEGGTLRDLVRRAPLSLQAACRYTRDIADALDYIHRQGIIHRDIKASNVLLDEEGRCYLSDFGIARTTTDSSHVTSTGSIIGTVHYMAPELFTGNQRATPSSDIYALGILLFEMVTGNFPFDGESQFTIMTMHASKIPPTPSSIVQNIPPMVDQIILKALEKQPELRYRNATELVEALDKSIMLSQALAADSILAPDTDDATFVEVKDEYRTALMPPEQDSLSLLTTRQQLALDDSPPSHIDQDTISTNNLESTSPNAPRTPKPKRARTMAVLVLVILLLILGPIGYVLYAHSTSNVSTATTPLSSTAVPPQPGIIHYTVQAGDECDKILNTQMRMSMATQVFNDNKPASVQALDAALGHNCDTLQPGLVLSLSPQYPLVAITGQVSKIEAMNAQQAAPDCTTACRLIVSIAPQVQVQLMVKTQLKVQVNSTIWAQAMMARKSIPDFDTYPYVDTKASIAGMSLSACDLQIDDVHDNNSLGCDHVMPNNIDADLGSWMFGVTGPEGINHWNYQLHLPTGTQVLFWLTEDNGSLKFQAGNPIYRYNKATNEYVKV